MSEPWAPAPAPLGPRVLAGALDTFVVLLLCGAYFLVPLLTRGLVLPMWGVLAAVVGYLVVPLSAFRRTVGMRLFGLELVARDGHAVGPGDVLFRELIGRGFFPAAFLFTVFAGVVASWLHLAAFVFPSGIGGLFFFVSAFAVCFAGLGHALVLNRDDRRSLADLMARSWVRSAVPRPAPTDAEELADFDADHRRRVRNVVLFEVALLIGALCLPVLLTQPTESTTHYAARLRRQKLQAQVKAEPDNEELSQELVRAWYVEGKEDEAHLAEQALAALRLRAQEQRRVKLEAAVEADPTSSRALAELLEVYDQRRQFDEAKVAYRRFLDASGDLDLRAGFGRWLWDRGFEEEAVAELLDTQKAGPTLEGLHSLLGRYLLGTHRLEPAQLELTLATFEDAEDPEAAAALAEVDGRLGPLPAARLKQLKRDFEKSHPR